MERIQESAIFHHVSLMPPMILPNLVSFDYKGIVLVISEDIKVIAVSSAEFIGEMLVWMAWVLKRFQIDFTRYTLSQLETVILASRVGVEM